MMLIFVVSPSGGEPIACSSDPADGFGVAHYARRTRQAAVCVGQPSSLAARRCLAAVSCRGLHAVGVWCGPVRWSPASTPSSRPATPAPFLSGTRVVSPLPLPSPPWLWCFGGPASSLPLFSSVLLGRSGPSRPPQLASRLTVPLFPPFFAHIQLAQGRRLQSFLLSALWLAVCLLFFSLGNRCPFSPF